MLEKLKHPDPLIATILTCLVLAFLFPARGSFASVFGIITNAAIAFLFFLYGARLSPQEALAGLTNWRLQLTILAFTFVVYPLLGVALFPTTGFLSHDLYQGIVYLTLVPSTVQSCVAFTGVAGGNTSGAVVSASVSSIVGVVLTPLLAMWLMSAHGGVHIDSSVFGDIALQLLLPFIIGQLTHRWTKSFASNKTTKKFDRLSIGMVVYGAFSKGIVSGVFHRVKLWELLFLIALAVALVYLMFWLTRFVSTKLGFDRRDTIAIQMCGTQKSLAAGLPMATVIFGDGSVGLLILPLMIYHLTQLVISSGVAARYARANAD